MYRDRWSYTPDHQEKAMSNETAGLIAAILVVTYNIRMAVAALRGRRRGPFI